MQIKSGEVLILLAASVMSFLANVPDRMLGNMIDRRVLLAALTAMVIVAMFRYLQILLLATISILAIGANLPAELASSLGISQLALIVSLAVLIAVALLNRVVRLLPMEKADPVSEISDTRRAMLAAISKGDQAALQRLLVMNADVNFILDGTTPLHEAASKGHPEIVRMLIGYGADFRVKNAAGKTALEVAQARKKFMQMEGVAHGWAAPRSAKPAHEETRRADADIWFKQHG